MFVTISFWLFLNETKIALLMNCTFSVLSFHNSRSSYVWCPGKKKMLKLIVFEASEGIYELKWDLLHAYYFKIVLWCFYSCAYYLKSTVYNSFSTGICCLVAWFQICCETKVGIQFAPWRFVRIIWGLTLLPVVISSIEALVSITSMFLA